MSSVTPKKYCLVKEDQKSIEGRTLYRIRALIDLPSIEKDSLGGYVESEENLSHEGTCWIGGEAYVYHQAKVMEHAIVQGAASMRHEAKIKGYAILEDNALLEEQATIEEHAHVMDSVILRGEVHVGGQAVVREYVCCYDHILVQGDAVLQGCGVLIGDGFFDHGTIEIN